MPTFHFQGKEQVKDYNPPLHLLRKIYSVGQSENMIIRADNLLAILTRRSMHIVRNSGKDFDKKLNYILVHAKNKERLTSDKNHRFD